MLRNSRSAIMLATIVTSFLACGVAPAAALVCPAPAGGAGADQTQTMAAALPAVDALDDAAKLNAAVTTLRAKGVSNAAIVDGLIASYCPVVARDAALNDDQKRARVRRFAARMVRLVYALDSADAVILDVPFRAGVIDEINAKAAAARVSPEAWVADAVERALKAVR